MIFLQRQEGSGRPRKTTEREDRAIVRAALTAPDASLSSIVRATSASVTSRTIHRRLTERRLTSRRTLYRLPLTSVQRQARLQWYRVYSHWNVTDWSRIVFSDESRFELSPNDQRRRVWRRPGQRYDTNLTVFRQTGRQPGVMVWGNISFNSRSPLVVIRRNLTAQRPRRMAFAKDMLRRIEDDVEFLKRIMFPGEASFHFSGIVNRRNVRIWGSENPHEYRQAQMDSPKVNVWCGLMHDRVIGPFFFTEKTVSSVVYLDMLENFVFPQLEELQPHVFLQQNGAPPQRGTIVRSSLNDHFTRRWIGRGGLIPWPPRSHDVTPLDFFLWGFVKDNVYRRRVSNIDDLKARITAAITSVDADMLAGTWREIEY
ncbi:Transposable element Tcb2 transposase, partial [Stegodyphus mimosarum]